MHGTYGLFVAVTSNLFPNASSIQGTIYSKDQKRFTAESKRQAYLQDERAHSVSDILHGRSRHRRKLDAKQVF